jgi:hypothetical protein
MLVLTDCCGQQSFLFHEYEETMCVEINASNSKGFIDVS